MNENINVYSSRVDLFIIFTLQQQTTVIPITTGLIPILKLQLKTNYVMGQESFLLL